MNINWMQTPSELTLHIHEREGCPVHYWIGGKADAPVVVLLHGATMDHRMFNAQVEALLPQYRVLVWDERGHGLSQPIGTDYLLEGCTRDLLAILDEQDIKQAIIGGQSWGGYVAQKLFLLAPERVTSLIIIGSTPLSKSYAPLEVWLSQATMPLFRLWPYSSLQKLIAQTTGYTKPVQQYAAKALSAITRENFLLIWQSVIQAIEGSGNQKYEITVPLLLLHGEQDQVGTIQRDMAQWAERGDAVIYTRIPQAGHNANQDNPLLTNKVLLQFLARYS